MAKLKSIKFPGLDDTYEIDTGIPEPAQDGTAGQVLATDGAGGRYWTDQTGGGGTGADGTTFTPSVSSDGTLSWTNDGGKDNPEPVNIKGEKGDTGAKGEKGDKGDTGATGASGYTPVKGTDYWTAADKSEMVDDVLAALPTWTGGSY